MKAGISTALGIDIGGSNTKLGLVALHGELSALRRMPTDAHGNDPGQFLERLLPLVDEVLAKATQPVGGIGVSMHGAIDDEQRGPIACNNTRPCAG